MATDALRQQPIAVVRTRPANPPSDRVFFGLMVLALWATVLYGFSKTYYAAGMIHAPLPDRLIHVHAILMTLWMSLLFVQVALVTARKVAWHRALGVYGFILALAIVTVGPMAATDSLRRGPRTPGPRSQDLLHRSPSPPSGMFAGFVFFAWRTRRRPAAHKRLVILANLAVRRRCRRPLARRLLPDPSPPAMNLVPLAFILAIAAYDLFSQGRVLKVTLCGSLAADGHRPRPHPHRIHRPLARLRHPHARQGLATKPGCPIHARLSGRAWVGCKQRPSSSNVKCDNSLMRPLAPAMLSAGIALMLAAAIGCAKIPAAHPAPPSSPRSRCAATTSFSRPACSATMTASISRSRGPHPAQCLQEAVPPAACAHQRRPCHGRHPLRLQHHAAPWAARMSPAETRRSASLTSTPCSSPAPSTQYLVPCSQCPTPHHQPKARCSPASPPSPCS